MLVKTVREHANRHGVVKEDGSHRVKTVGATYEHPEPRTLIESGFVVDAAAAAADAKQASKGKPATDA
ncbi:hypothetical protein IP68_02200 [Blastomonas sp. AAP25]|uniref:hypothetical protein n=1 Tax=Blastomonas sp. AAP25 TaxID=1523416 RepID=UPI0006B8DA6A|nr:hypothetical protein [Blastomonas sp. AAP25]KPF76730.1 hypothetical protein IP68_02200 [Blastomonas sp. AAP25]